MGIDTPPPMTPPEGIKPPPDPSEAKTGIWNRNDPPEPKPEIKTLLHELQRSLSEWQTTNYQPRKTHGSRKPAKKFTTTPGSLYMKTKSLTQAAEYRTTGK